VLPVNVTFAANAGEERAPLCQKIRLVMV